MMAAMRIHDMLIDARRIGAGWDQEREVRWVMLTVPTCPCCPAPAVGDALYPGVDDLPHLMVVDRVDPGKGGVLVVAVAHDTPPPSSYAPASWWRTEMLGLEGLT